MFSQDPQQTTPASLADIVREETNDGRLIVRFLIDLMQGSLANAKPCHRLDAARQLLNIGFAPAHAFIAANTSAGLPAQPRLPASSTHRPDPASFHQDLAALICEETDNGRAAVRFLVDVMQGNIDDFKPHHRLSAAKELLRRGFDSPTPALEDEDHAAANDCYIDSESQGSAPVLPPAQSPVRRSPYVAHYNRYQQEFGPFDFRTYDDEDFRRDCFGDYALQHVLGSESAVQAATQAVIEYRRRANQLRSESDQTAQPCPAWSPVPADAPLPEAIYGYQVLLYIYGSEGAARVAAHAAGRHHRLRQAVASGPGICSDSSQDSDCSDSPDPPYEHPPPETPSGPARISLDRPRFVVDSTTPHAKLQHAL